MFFFFSVNHKIDMESYYPEHPPTAAMSVAKTQKPASYRWNILLFHVDKRFLVLRTPPPPSFSSVYHKTDKESYYPEYYSSHSLAIICDKLRSVPHVKELKNSSAYSNPSSAGLIALELFKTWTSGKIATGGRLIFGNMFTSECGSFAVSINRKMIP